MLGNPSNIFYVKAYIENLQKKYNNNKTGKSLAKFQELGARMAQKKAIAQENWDEAIKHGLEGADRQSLGQNRAHEHGEGLRNRQIRDPADFEIELYYLKTALMPNPKDPDVNKLCAIALAASAMSIRPLPAGTASNRRPSPTSEEAKRHIAYLNAQRMKRGERGSGDDGSGMMRPAGATGPIEEILTPEKRLLRKIAQQPDQMEPYIELSQMYINEERYGDAEKILERPTSTRTATWKSAKNGKTPNCGICGKRFRASKTRTKRKQHEKHFFAKELEICKNRCERYPNNPALPLRFGLSLHAVEAIQRSHSRIASGQE